MRVGVTGIGIMSASGVGVEPFEAAVRTGRPGDGPAPQLTAPAHQEKVAARIPSPSPRDEAGRRDPGLRLAVAAGREALLRAGLSPGQLPSGGGLLLGTSLGGAIAGQRWHRSHLEGSPGGTDQASQALLHAVSDHVARQLGLDGPRITISNACVSGTNALGLALDMIRDGECDLAVAGGVDTLHSFNFCGFATLWALTQDRCRPFDSQRTGMLLGEAAAFLVLESEAAIKKRGATPLVELAGYGAAGDAVHITAPDREGGGAFRAMDMALREACVEPADVDLVSLHGTGTMYADGMEAAAMGRIFGDRVREIPATSLRPVTGHTMGSAGAVDSVACVLALLGGFLPPTPGHRELDPDLAAAVSIVTEVTRRPVEVALNTSSGFAGSNAAVVLRRWRDEP